MLNKNFGILKTLYAIGLSILLIFFIIFCISSEPLTAIKFLVFGPLKNIRLFGNVIECMTPLMFTGLGMLIVFSSKQFNLSTEGAFHFSGGVAAMVAIGIPISGIAHDIVGILIAGIAGVIITIIPYLVKHKTKADEFVVSIMLNYAIIFLTTFLILQFFRNPADGSFASYKFPSEIGLGRLIPKTRVNLGFIIAIITVIISYFFLEKTPMGYKIRVTGKNKEFAEYLGFNTFKIILISQIIGGFIIGVGGAVTMYGTYDKFTWETSLGYGWDGIIVSILAKNKIQYIPLCAFFLAYIRTGAFIMASSTDVQSEIINIAQAIIIILVISERFLNGMKTKQIYKNSKVAKEMSK